MRLSAWALLTFASAASTSASNTPSWIQRGGDNRRRLGWLTSRRLALTAGVDSNANALDETGCSPTVADGGWGFCGPASCKDAYVTCPAAEDDRTQGGGPPNVNGVMGGWISSTNNGEHCSPFRDRFKSSLQALF